MTVTKTELLDTLFEAALIIDQDENIIYFNHHFSTLTKSSPRQIQKKKKLSLILDYQAEILSKLINAASKAGAPQLTGELEIALIDTPSEKFVFVTKVSPIENNLFLVCLNDMTIERRLYEKYKQQLKELELTHNQIIQADKLTTIGEMTANISHEISNPLTIATGNLEIVEVLLDQKINEAEQEIIKNCVIDIKDSHQRINTIMTNMKTFLHQSESEREYTNLSILLQKTLQFLSTKLEDAKITVNIISENAEVIGLIDAGQIEQVYINLIKNSIDAYQGKPGVITIKIERDHHLNLITFCDEGPGINDQDRERIFEAFYTTKKIGEGTGLGLAISQKIISAHKGELVCLNNEHSGAQFQIRLPSIEVMSYTQNEFLLGRKTSIGLKRILIVDDEVQILNLLNKIISDQGMVFIGSANPEDALQMLDELPLDLIIVDYHMPQMNGDEFIKKVRELNKEVPVLYLSTAENKDKFHKDQESLKLAGMITKPFTTESILKAIQDGLKRTSSWPS